MKKSVHGAVLTKTRNANFYMAQFFVEKNAEKHKQRRFSQRDKTHRFNQRTSLFCAVVAAAWGSAWAPPARP